MRSPSTNISLFPSLLTFLVLFSLNLTLSSARCHPSDAKALLQLQIRFPQFSHVSWDPKLDCCYDWTGYPVVILCNTDGRVTQLTLDGTSTANGLMPSSIGDLPYLTILTWSGGDLVGPLPISLSKLTNLFKIDLQTNKLNGSLAVLGHLKSLEFAELSNNEFSGPIPSLLARLRQIQTLSLGSNRLAFDFSNVDLPPGLKELSIDNNKIYGSLPKQLGQLPLRSLNVSNNHLCGPIPKGRRIKHFSPDSFAHNKCLCGLPLPPCKS